MNSAGMSMEAELITLFRDAGLEPPRLPERFAAVLAPQTTGVVASRPQKHSLYDLSLHVDDFIDGGAAGLALGFAGHGVGSQAVHYYLADERVGVFIQQRWGTPFDSPDQDALYFRTLTNLACELAARAARPEYAECFSGGRRLLAIDSSFSGTRAGWVVAGNVGQWLPCPLRGAPAVALQALMAER